MHIDIKIIILSIFLIISSTLTGWTSGKDEYVPQPTYNTNTTTNDTATNNTTRNLESNEETEFPRTTQVTPPVTPSNIPLKSSYIMSNEGILYRFYTDTPLPAQTSIVDLTIRNITSSFDHSLKKTVVLNNNADFFEYVISPNNFVFLPLLPYIIEVSYLDQTGSPLGFSQTKFNAVLSFTAQKLKSTDLMMSEPIALSNNSFSFKEYEDRKQSPQNAPILSDLDTPAENQAFFSDIYKSTDDKITHQLFSQLKTHLENYNNDQSTKKYLLITGISYSNQVTPNLYQKILNKVNILRNQLYAFDKNVFMQTFILVDVWLIFDNSSQYAGTLYQNTEQVIFSISSSENTLKKIQNQHNQKNLAFIQTVNNNIYKQYNSFPSRLLLAKNNIVSAHTYYYAAQKLISQSRIESYISKTEQINYAIDTWLYESEDTLASLQNTKSNLENINRDEINTSLEDVKESMDNLEIENSGLYANGELLINLSKKIKQYRENITSLRTILKNYLVPYNNSKNKIENPDNIVLINKLYIYIDELIALYESLEAVLYENTSTAPIEMSKVYTNLHKSDAILGTIEDTLINITNEITSYPLIKNADIIIYQIEKNTYSRQENISNGLSNVISVSEFLKVWNNVAIPLIKIVKRADKINDSLTNIESDVNRIFLSTNRKTIADYNYQRIQSNESATPPQSDVYILQENPATPTYTEQTPKQSSTVIESLDDDMMLQPQNNKYALLGNGKLNQSQIVRYITAHTQNNTINIPNLVNTYMTETKYEGINSDIAIAQMLYVTDTLSKKKLLSINNPGGLGGPSSQNWELYPFQDLKTGIRAHVQHIKSYVVDAQFSTDVVDPRHAILSNNKLIASAQNLKTLTKSWYPYNDDAYSHISGVIEDMYRYNGIE